jgi:hypothetical protein
MNIKAVCFDLDGVYFTPESFQRFKKNISNGIDEETVNNILYKKVIKHVSVQTIL